MENEKRLIYLEDAKEALTGWETDTAPTAVQRWTEGMRMSCDVSYFEPLPCPKCNKLPLYVVWEHRHGDRKIHRFSCCGIRAGRYTKQDAIAKWNLLALKYALGERREGE